MSGWAAGRLWHRLRERSYTHTHTKCFENKIALKTNSKTPPRSTEPREQAAALRCGPKILGKGLRKRAQTFSFSDLVFCFFFLFVFWAALPPSPPPPPPLRCPLPRGEHRPPPPSAASPERGAALRSLFARALLTTVFVSPTALLPVVALSLLPPSNPAAPARSSLPKCAASRESLRAERAAVSPSPSRRQRSSMLRVQSGEQRVFVCVFLFSFLLFFFF